jgi:hypothetical protein
MYPTACDNCHRWAAHAVRRAMTTLTFFFISVLPVMVQHSTQCTYCGATHRISRHQAAALQRPYSDSSEAR